MKKKMVTPLGTIGNIIVFDDMPMAHDDPKSVGKTVETLVVEFDQVAFEEYISSGSNTPAANRPLKMVRIERRARGSLSPTKVT